MLSIFRNRQSTVLDNGARYAKEEAERVDSFIRNLPFCFHGVTRMTSARELSDEEIVQSFNDQKELARLEFSLWLKQVDEIEAVSCSPNQRVP